MRRALATLVCAIALGCTAEEPTVPAPAKKAPTAPPIQVVKVSPPVRVPDVRGKDIDAARAAIEKAGFAVGEVATRKSEAPRGQVIDQVPDGRLLAAKGKAIDLVVSEGP